MRVVLVDNKSVVIRAESKTTLRLPVCKKVILSEVPSQTCSISEVITNDNDGLGLDLFLKDGKVEMRLRRSYSDTYSDDLLEKLWNRYHEDIKISVYLRYASDANETLSDFASFEDIGIREILAMFSCQGTVNTNKTFFDREPKVNVKIIADVPTRAASRSKSKPVKNCKKPNGRPLNRPVKDSNRLPNNPVKDSSRSLSNPVEVGEYSCPSLPPFQTKILEEGVRSDVTIIAKNGAEIKCHTNFLSASSPVLTALFQDWTLESQTRRVEMNDFSEDGVRAFLHFIYFGNLEEPWKRVDVAFEVFKLAEKYDVQILKEEMTTNLLERGDGVIKVELAFQIYMFTRNIDSAVELRTKARGILKANFKKLQALDEFKELFNKSPDVAMEVFGDFMNSS